MNAPVAITLEQNDSGKVGFYNTGTFNYPGVGQYKVEKSSIEIKKKSPVATIGQESRFPKENPLLHYIAHVPH
jgi:hypothetical protein